MKHDAKQNLMVTVALLLALPATYLIAMSGLKYQTDGSSFDPVVPLLEPTGHGAQKIVPVIRDLILPVHPGLPAILYYHVQQHTGNISNTDR